MHIIAGALLKKKRIPASELTAAHLEPLKPN